MMLRRRLFQLPALLTLLTATLLGFFLAETLRNLSLHQLSDAMSWASQSHGSAYWAWLRQQGIFQLQGDASGFQGTSHRVISEALYLKDQTSILCMVMLDRDRDKWLDPFYVTDEYTPTMTTAELAISQTWGRRCSRLLFFTDLLAVTTEPVIRLTDIPSINSWTALHKALTYVANNHIDDYKWFAIVEEDTFVIMENLAYFVSVLNYSMPYYMGHALTSWGLDYNAIGPGTILSQAALRKVYQRLAKGHCEPSIEPAETALGRCLADAGVIARDSRDVMGRARFMLFQPELLLLPGSLSLFDRGIWAHDKYPRIEVRMT